MKTISREKLKQIIGDGAKITTSNGENVSLVSLLNPKPQASVPTVPDPMIALTNNIEKLIKAVLERPTEPAPVIVQPPDQKPITGLSANIDKMLQVFLKQTAKPIIAESSASLRSMDKLSQAIEGLIRMMMGQISKKPDGTLHHESLNKLSETIEKLITTDTQTKNKESIMFFNMIKDILGAIIELREKGLNVNYPTPRSGSWRFKIVRNDKNLVDEIIAKEVVGK